MAMDGDDDAYRAVLDAAEQAADLEYADLWVHRHPRRHLCPYPIFLNIEHWRSLPAAYHRDTYVPFCRFTPPVVDRIAVELAEPPDVIETFLMLHGPPLTLNQVARLTGKGKGTIHDITTRLAAKIRADYRRYFPYDPLEEAAVSMRRWNGAPFSTTFDGTLTRAQLLLPLLANLSRKGITLNSLLGVAPATERILFVSGGHPGGRNDTLIWNLEHEVVRGLHGVGLEQVRGWCISEGNYLYDQVRGIVEGPRPQQVSAARHALWLAVAQARLVTAAAVLGTLAACASVDDCLATMKNLKERLRVALLPPPSTAAFRVRNAAGNNVAHPDAPINTDIVYRKAIWARLTEGLASRQHGAVWWLTVADNGFVDEPFVARPLSERARVHASRLMRAFSHWITRPRTTPERVIGRLKKTIRAFHAIAVRSHLVARDVFLVACALYNIALRAGYYDIDPAWTAPATPAERAEALRALAYIRQHGLYQYWLARGAPMYDPEPEGEPAPAPDVPW